MTNTNKPGIVFWIIGIIAFIWNGMGVNAYIQMAFKTDAVMSAMTPEQIAMMEATPAWVTALFAIAVFSGLLGCIALLLRKKIAVTLLLVSLITATIQQAQWLLGDGRELYDQFQGTIMPIMIVVFAAFLFWYSKSAKAKGILS